jgi:hypothetical protein
VKTEKSAFRKSRHSKHEEIIGGKIVMVNDKHEHIWQLHPMGFSEGIHHGRYATFYCHCGSFKEVLLKKL